MSMKSEIDAMIEEIIPSEPTFIIKKGWNDSNLNIEKLNHPTTKSTSKIAQYLVNTCSERIVNKKHKILFTADPMYTIQIAMSDFIIHFLTTYLGGSNNRLTSTYQWYKRFSCDKLTPMDFKNDLFGVYKYLYDRTDPLTEIDVKNGLGLLQLIKNRYEAKGMKREKSSNKRRHS